MGLGPCMKETTLHHYRDPLTEVLDRDPEVNLRGIVIVGSPQDNDSKYLVGTRTAVWMEGMRLDGAILSCNGIGNNHVDYANTIAQLEMRNIPTVALSLCPASEFVVQNEYLDGVLDYYKSEPGKETQVLAENTVTELDARKALAMLKLKMRKKKADNNQ